MEIRYLKQEEKEKSRILYEECFPEDSEEFTDYYYTEKCRDNAVLAAIDEDAVVSMIHLNPYRISLYGQEAQVHYVVAVATSRGYRRQGIMRELMRRALGDLHDAGEPFAFLMPANPDYYYSAGFEYWDSQIQVKQDPDMIFRPGMQIAAAKDRDAPALAVFSDGLLKKRFDLFIKRDAVYYRRLIREQESQNGEVAVLRQYKKSGEEAELFGSFCVSREGAEEFREPILQDPGTEIVNPVMMGRILNLSRFCGMIKRPDPWTGTVELRDTLIPENNGTFRICFGPEGGSAERVTVVETAEPGDRAESEDLAVFGKRVFSGMRIFINEIV